jgi:hypothetical protein
MYHMQFVETEKRNHEKEMEGETCHFFSSFNFNKNPFRFRQRYRLLPWDKSNTLWNKTYFLKYISLHKNWIWEDTKVLVFNPYDFLTSF